MSKQIPEGWNLFSINNFLGADSLFCDGDWVESKDQDEEGTNRLVQLGDIGDGNFLDKSTRYMNDAQFARLRCTALKEGDILIARMPDPLGRACLFPKLNQRCATVVDVAVLRSPKADIYWLMYTINSHGVRRQIESLSAGTTRTRISRKLFSSILFLTPNVTVQTRIANVLETIDRTITHTEALIEKYQQIKAGLMHDLFTRGIGADGKLRPTREEAPELYRESAIGWIPKEWEVSALRECLIDSPTNGIYKSQDQIGDGILMIGQTAFTKERSIDFSLCRRGSISAAEEKQYFVSENNILITRVFATVDGVGLPTLAPQMYEKAVFESNMMRLRVDVNEITPLLLFEWLRNSKVRRLIVAGANASNQVSINQKALNVLPVPLIGGDEQSRIVNTINAYNDKYFIEKMYLKKLKKQKSGLMHDLLTGKVQVTIDDTEVADR